MWSIGVPLSVKRFDRDGCEIFFKSKIRNQTFCLSSWWFLFHCFSKSLAKSTKLRSGSMAWCSAMTTAFSTCRNTPIWFVRKPPTTWSSGALTWRWRRWVNSVCRLVDEETANYLVICYIDLEVMEVSWQCMCVCVCACWRGSSQLPGPLVHRPGGGGGELTVCVCVCAW